MLLLFHLDEKRWTVFKIGIGEYFRLQRIWLHASSHAIVTADHSVQAERERGEVIRRLKSRDFLNPLNESPNEHSNKQFGDKRNHTIPLHELLSSEKSYSTEIEEKGIKSMQNAICFNYTVSEMIAYAISLFSLALQQLQNDLQTC